MAAKAKRTKAGDGRGRRAGGSARGLYPDSFALLVEELRGIVSRIVARVGVERFVSRLLPLIDGLREGRTGEAARAARGSKDRLFRRLASAVRRAAARGEFVAARNTAILAASYAYQESIDYACVLFDYLDGLRRKRRARAG